MPNRSCHFSQTSRVKTPAGAFLTAISSAMFFYQTASQKWNDWLTTDESARKISEPILGTIDQQLAKYWKMASEQVAMAEQVFAKAK
jgi:hypothetical protein